MADAGELRRLFVAIPVPPDARAACRELIEPVRTTPFGRFARWVQLDTLHVTLRFLGDTPASTVPAVAAAVAAAVGDQRRFPIHLTGAGSFPPGGRKIRALWLGIREGASDLATLSEALSAAVAPLGWAPDPRPFRPHLTVARTDSTGMRDAALTAQALEAAAETWSAAFVAERVVLFRSHLGGGPARHEVVAEIVLRT